MEILWTLFCGSRVCCRGSTHMYKQWAFQENNKPLFLRVFFQVCKDGIPWIYKYILKCTSHFISVFYWVLQCSALLVLLTQPSTTPCLFPSAHRAYCLATGGGAVWRTQPAPFIRDALIFERTSAATQQSTNICLLRGAGVKDWDAVQNMAVLSGPLLLFFFFPPYLLDIPLTFAARLTDGPPAFVNDRRLHLLSSLSSPSSLASFPFSFLPPSDHHAGADSQGVSLSLARYCEIKVPNVLTSSVRGQSTHRRQNYCLKLVGGGGGSVPGQGFFLITMSWTVTKTECFLWWTHTVFGSFVFYVSN